MNRVRIVRTGALWKVTQRARGKMEHLEVYLMDIVSQFTWKAQRATAVPISMIWQYPCLYMATILQKSEPMRWIVSCFRRQC